MISLTVFDSLEHPISALTSDLVGFEAAPLLPGVGFLFPDPNSRSSGFEGKHAGGTVRLSAVLQ